MSDQPIATNQKSPKAPTNKITPVNPVKIGVIGIGVVGTAVYEGFKQLGHEVFPYDKYKEIGSLSDVLNTFITFLCLPTLYSDETHEYDKSAIFEICEQLSNLKYNGIVAVKSTVEPKTTQKLTIMYPSLKFIHNPEFLSARTNKEDFMNQNHIIIGITNQISGDDIHDITELFEESFPKSSISICESNESEAMKSFVNCFYSVKVQFFNELFLLCKKEDIDYDVVRGLMIGNGWINPMHTKVPGPDGYLSYGGMCFPKDTNALLQYMIRSGTSHKVLQATVEERNEFRKD